MMEKIIYSFSPAKIRYMAGRAKPQKTIKHIFLALCMAFVITGNNIKPANAFNCLDCICILAVDAAFALTIVGEHNLLIQPEVVGISGGVDDGCALGPGQVTCRNGEGSMGDHEEWLMDVLFGEHILPAMAMMTQQLSAVMMQQMQILGSFFDAKQQMEVQRTFEKMTSETYRRYIPSAEICTFGTNIRSLASAENRSTINRSIMSERAILRQLGNVNLNSAKGKASDSEGRLRQFKEIYCDWRDNNKVFLRPDTGLEKLCERTDIEPLRVNKDIDYTRTIETPLTLDINFIDDIGDLSNDEEDILAMSSYLYAHDVPDRITEWVLGPEESQIHYYDMRSVMAKRSVAENSFFAIAGMKSVGNERRLLKGSAPDTLGYMGRLLNELGYTDPADIAEVYGTAERSLLGLTGPQDALGILMERPSYMAQMEVLAKNIYQRPKFYSELYDHPTNVARKGVAMRAIDLMLERDMFDSQLRSEAIISILLELEVMKHQSEIDDMLGNLDPSAKKSED
jgi:hypothetical protein